MRLFLLLSIFIGLAFAIDKPHPQAYATLGNVIYENVAKIKALKSIYHFKDEHNRIDKYVKDVRSAKRLGYDVSSKEASSQKLIYLDSLRKLRISNDYFLTAVKDAYQFALKKQDSSLFIKIVNIDILDKKRYKKSILNYYKAHKKEINPAGIIQAFLDKEPKKSSTKSLKKPVKKNTYYKTKAQRHAEKIKRIREKDKLKEAAMKEKFEQELLKRKKEIREEQEKELFR